MAPQSLQLAAELVDLGGQLLQLLRQPLQLALALLGIGLSRCGGQLRLELLPRVSRSLSKLFASRSDASVRASS